MTNFINFEELDKRAPLGAFSTLDMEVLIPEVKNISHANGLYLEIGVDKGKSLWIAREVSNRMVRVVGVDLKQNPNITGTIFIQGDSSTIGMSWSEGKIDVLFIDGDHSYLGCKADIDSWYPHMKKDGVMLFHDCDESSPGVLQAVSEFVNTHTVKSFELFKRTDKNTSMAKIQL